jgi:hypothetical protein
MRSNIKDYGGKTHYTDSQNSDKTAPSGREAASPETFGYTLVCNCPYIKPQINFKTYKSTHKFNLI